MEEQKLSGAARLLLYAHEVGYRVNRDGEVISSRGNTLKLKRMTSGYLCFTVQCRTRKLKGNVPVHRMVAYQKFGETILHPKIQVRHLNGKKEDNGAPNIAIGTSSDNAMDVPEAVRLSRAKRAASAKRKLNDSQLRKFWADRKKGMTVGQLANKYGISKTGAYYIVSGYTYV